MIVGPRYCPEIGCFFNTTLFAEKFTLNEFLKKFCRFILALNR